MHLYERLTFFLVAGTFGLFFIAFLIGVFGVVFTLNPAFERALRARLAPLWLLCEDKGNDFLAYCNHLFGRLFVLARTGMQRVGLRILRRS
jgi:hypothetical protein